MKRTVAAGAYPFGGASRSCPRRRTISVSMPRPGISSASWLPAGDASVNRQRDHDRFGGDIDGSRRQFVYYSAVARVRRGGRIMCGGVTVFFAYE